MLDGIPTIAAAADLIKSRRLSPVELVEACLQRIYRHESSVHSFITVQDNSARAAARNAETEIAHGRYRGPLHGIPIGIKDLFNTRGTATTAHSRILQNNVPDNDAAAVTSVLDAGAIVLGKLALHELALGGPSFDLPWPPARNPWDTERFTHGSSSGTGAAIAAGFILGGPATDTLGSARFPAALCGVTGLKPTLGRVSRVGVIPLAPSLDHVGVMAWTAEDCAILLQVMAGHDPDDPASIDVPVPDYRAALTPHLQGVRIGVARHTYEDDNRANPVTHAAIETALEVFRQLGAVIKDIRIPPLADFAAVGNVLTASEAYALHESNFRERPEDFGAIFRSRISAAIFYTGADYARAVAYRRHLSRELDAAMATVDLVVTAVVPSEAPRIRDVSVWPPQGRPSMVIPFNVSGHPAMSVCCGYSEAGLPLALQIAGRRFAEGDVLRAGHAYETATDWRDRRPAMLSAPRHDGTGIVGPSAASSRP